MEEKYMKIVVIGALGHIGSRLIRNLPNEFPNAEIVMIDNMKTQRYPSLFNLPKEGSFYFIEDDVTTMDLEPVLKGTDAVIHLAALTDAAGSFGRAEEVESVNFTATEVVAKACLETGVPIIHSSSTSVYGTQNDVVDEFCSLDELKPQSPYAETKLREEELMSQMYQKDGLQVITFRFGTIFGTSPGMRFHTAVNKFCWQAVMGQSLTVWKTAYEQLRPYLDLGDAVRAMAFVIKNNMFDGKIYNVVTANSTVKEVVEVIRQKVPELKVNFVEHEIMNQLSYEVLNTRMEKAGFEAQGDIEKGIKDTVSLLKQSRSC
jgi:nucleoside-diphosphate-sugar epimerase